ncbi:MAG TPA: NUDIX hydrolase [Deltaproteobacteria bacterium]|nr:NUDIX hydrolase [Deltaproteobacteria bacterium]HOM29219.1 NUDIX hydrolase [Deltaproteobacteria bacterium]HPP79793.1 NUDIX hydrolase [Deltaproteobacteria bacterium]
MEHEWNRIGSRIAFRNKLVNVRLDTYHFLPNDIVKDFTVFELGDWVNVIPMTSQGLVVTIRQYRHGVMRETVEIPGGLISKEDAGPMEAALREMTEETGYTSREVIHIGTVEPNPAIQTNRCYTFLALDCLPDATQNLDPTESVRLELVHPDEVFRMIKDGTITHALVVAAFCHLLIHEAASRGVPSPLNAYTCPR